MAFGKSINSYISFISKFSVYGILLMGIVIRLILFFQNRNLIIDEANIVHNLYERNFAALLLPLSYEQYAPPLFLWIEEICSLLFGYGEKALKIYPLLCGIASLFVFRKIMKKFVPEESLWLPLALMAFSPYLTEFSTTIKQYMPDAFIMLLLLWLALEKDILTLSRKKFLLFWGITGMIAITASMPSVFALGGIGAYYAYNVLRNKKTELLWTLAYLSLIWLTIFGVYFRLILYPQIGSDYLQNYHLDYFLFATPSNKTELLHNWYRIREIINNSIGYGDFNFKCAIAMMVTGIIILLRKNMAVLILFLTPVLLTFIAAALNQFSLIMRVCLFLLPLMLVFFSMGFGSIYAVRFFPIQILLIIGGVKMINAFNNFHLFDTYHGFHEITEGLDYIVSKNVNGNQVYIHHASTPTYIYYTDIHPERNRYRSLQGAHLLTWDIDYNSITSRISDTVYFLYTGGFPEQERQQRTEQLSRDLEQIGYFEQYICYVYVYVPRKPDL